MGMKLSMCVSVRADLEVMQQRQAVLEDLSSSALLPPQTKLLLLLGSFKPIILGYVFGLGFIPFKRVVGRKKEEMLFNYFCGISSCSAWFRAALRNFIFLRCVLQDRALRSDGHQRFYSRSKG